MANCAAGLALIDDLGERAIIQMDPVQIRVALLAANPPDNPVETALISSFAPANPLIALSGPTYDIHPNLPP
jgi:hypothetical protein